MKTRLMILPMLLPAMLTGCVVSPCILTDAEGDNLLAACLTVKLPINLEKSLKSQLKPTISATSRDTEEAVACKRQCKLDQTKTYCTGCGRTLEQIREAGKNVR